MIMKTDQELRDEKMMRRTLVIENLPGVCYFRFVPDRLTIQKMIMQAAYLPSDFTNFEKFQYPDSEDSDWHFISLN